jgi:hypothetical protein
LKLKNSKKLPSPTARIFRQRPSVRFDLPWRIIQPRRLKRRPFWPVSGVI